MIGHDYMITSPYIHILFTTSHKDDIVVNFICDYVLHDYSHIYHRHGKDLQQPRFNFLNIVIYFLLMSYYHMIAKDEFKILLTIYEWTYGYLK
jgi:hypothetical protein